MMETGTGKTYTYTKTIFELNKLYGIFKFIVIVPTLSIKAGTIDFLRGASSREHFKEQYDKTINLHIVESKKTKKGKSYIPTAISSFVEAGKFDKSQIQVMIINAGMINSDTMSKSFDSNLMDEYSVPFEAIAATAPFVIIDEPHKFTKANKTWENIQKLTGQYIIRYGATFPEKEIKVKNFLGKEDKVIVKDYHNLVYQLSSVDSFNRNLVKGVIGHITEFENGKDTIVEFLGSDGTEAKFELREGITKVTKKTFTLIDKASLVTIHPAMTDLLIDKLNRSVVILSNGLELKKGDKINPFSYDQTLQETMLRKTIKNHFKLEKELLTRDVRIKPLTLFFIDNIEEYRADKGKEDGYIKKTIEALIKAEIIELLKDETCVSYKEYLEKSLKDISLTHGGYFSKDNSDSDEKIAKEVEEILHDKQSMLSLDNPRRFIFSKWTLREGWDNPNVFQICKLRSSGSETSKLQEVGRGLRLPVNEFGNRVKDEQFYLNYYVDFTEASFIDNLITEINSKSGAISIEINHLELDANMIQLITGRYPITEEELLDTMDSKDLITRTNKFKENGYEYVKNNYPLIFEGVNSNKVRIANDVKKKITIRQEKYPELKELWEQLNSRVILEYKVKDENEFKKTLIQFLTTIKMGQVNRVQNKIVKLVIEDNLAIKDEVLSLVNTEDSRLTTMKYSDFVKQLAVLMNVNIGTLHDSITQSNININDYLNSTTIRIIKSGFDNYLMYNSINNFTIGYQKVTNTVHPTKITNDSGQVLSSINAGDVGVINSEAKVADNYFFNELYFDSSLEKSNIITNIEEVIVFTKIPKNSIKIPIAGGKSYSPDFAYVIKHKDGKQNLHFVVETKNIDEQGLRDEEKIKIEYAKKFFGDAVKIEFRTQFSNDKMLELIKKIYV